MKYASRRLRRLAQRHALIPIPSRVSHLPSPGLKARPATAGTWLAAEPASHPATVAELELLRHELRTPLTAIMGLAELLSATDLPARAVCWLSTLQACGQQMASLIDRALRSPWPAWQPSQSGVVDGLRWLESLVASHWPAAQAGSTQLVLVCGAGAHGLWSIDEVMLRQALDNLLANAIRFSGQGRVVLRAQVVARAGEASSDLELSVENFPSGSRCTAANLRDASEFADRTYRMHSRGHGLRVVDAVCQRFGGTLRQSGLAAGSMRFILRLPGIVPPGDGSPRPFIPALLQRMRGCILLLEAAQEQSIAALLQLLGITCTVIRREQLPKLQSWPDAWVLIASEMRLPGSLATLNKPVNGNPVSVISRVRGRDGPLLFRYPLPEPWFLADLQHALLRCLLEQEFPAGHQPDRACDRACDWAAGTQE